MEKILADFVVGDDLTVEPIEKVLNGATLITKNGEEEVASYTIVVIGDVNGDGKVNPADVIHFLKNIASNAEAVISDDIVADVDLDGIRSLKDIRTMVKSLAGDTNTVIGK